MVAHAHEREMRPEFVLIELHAGSRHRIAYPLREREELLMGLRAHPPDPRVTPIREESAAL